MIINKEGKENKATIALCGGSYRQCLRPRAFIGIDTVRMGDTYVVAISKFRRENESLKYYADTLKTRFDSVWSLGNLFVIFELDGKMALFFDEKAYPSAEFVDTSLEFKYEDFKLFLCQGIESEPHQIIGFKENERWGYIRLFYKPEEIIPAKYLTVGSMERGLALVEYEEGKFGYVSEEGIEYFKRE